MDNSELDKFRDEVKLYSTNDIKLILVDQMDLYSTEEIEILQQELKSRPVNSVELEWKIEDKELERKEKELHEKQRLKNEEDARRENERKYQIRLNHLKSEGAEGYYEYKVISLSDTAGLFRKNSGRVDICAMTQALNELGLEGWHLVTAYSNELGKNAFSTGIGGVVSGVNATIDENILIFERFVRIKKEECHSQLGGQ